MRRQQCLLILSLSMVGTKSMKESQKSGVVVVQTIPFTRRFSVMTKEFYFNSLFINMIG